MKSKVGIAFIECDTFPHTNPFWSHRMGEKGIFEDSWRDIHTICLKTIWKNDMYNHVTISILLSSCMTYGQKILKSYCWYSKLTVGKFVSNSCCVSHPAWILQKLTLNMSKYELWSLYKFSHKSVKKTISLRPFMQVTKMLSPWIEDCTETLIKLLQSWGTLRIQPLDRTLWKENCDIIVIIL